MDILRKLKERQEVFYEELVSIRSFDEDFLLTRICQRAGMIFDKFDEEQILEIINCWMKLEIDQKKTDTSLLAYVVLGYLTSDYMTEAKKDIYRWISNTCSEGRGDSNLIEVLSLEPLISIDDI